MSSHDGISDSDEVSETDSGMDSSRSENSDGSVSQDDPVSPQNGSVSPGAESDSDPTDAFQSLGNDVRMRILEALLERTGDDAVSSTMTFSELFDATDVDTSAGFAYHLDQLAGQYLRKTEDGYELTSTGLRIARAIETGVLTRSVDRPPVHVSDPCPFCSERALEARAVDNVVTVACTDCECQLLSLQFPPSGFDAHGDDLPEAFDRHHRHRIALMQDGVCPECSGAVDARLVDPTTDVATAVPAPLEEHVQAAFECHQCGHELRCPVTLVVLEHPAVVSFYHERGRNVRSRPIWNVGREWAETVLSREPTCVRITVDIDGDVLALYLDDDLRVREVQRSAE